MAGLSPNKIPLRSLSSLFSHLAPSVKSQLNSAFAEAEDQINSHNSSIVDHQERRSLSGLIQQPVLTTTVNNRGFDVQWDRLDDKSISLYEIQISTNSIFSNPDTYRVVDTSFALEGIGATVYARVRGVRFDGTCGLWSDTAQINAFAESASPVVYSVGFDNVRQFYKDDAATAFPVPIQKLVIQSQRQNGGIMVFGSFGTRDGEFGLPGNFIRMRLNEQTLSSFDLSTLPMDGIVNWWSVGLGPTFLTHSQFYFSTSDLVNPNTEANNGSSGGSGTGTGWTFTGNGALGTMETVFPSPNPDTDHAKYFVTGIPVGGSHNSKHLHLTNFGFNIPSANNILGIKVKFTGAWVVDNCDANKSFPQLNMLNLIDDTGTERSGTPITANTIEWPRSTPFTAGSPLESQTYGSSTYLWGETAGFWTPAKINSANFGINLRVHFFIKFNDTIASSVIHNGGSTSETAYLYGLEMTVYSENPTNKEVRIDMQYFVADGSGFGGQCTNATINVIEFGDVLSS